MAAPVPMNFDRSLDDIVKENSKAAAAAKKKISKKQTSAGGGKTSGKGPQKKPKVASKKIAGKEAIKQSRGKLQQLKRAAIKNETISRAKNQRENKINARRGIAPSKKQSGKGKQQAVQTTKMQPGVRGKINKNTPKKNKIQMIMPQQQPAKKQSQKNQKSGSTPNKQSKGALQKSPRGANNAQQINLKRKPLRMKQVAMRSKKATPTKQGKASGGQGGNPSPRAVTISIVNEKAMTAKRQAAAMALTAQKQRRQRLGASKNVGGVGGGGRRKVVGGGARQGGGRAGKKEYKVGGPRR